MKYIIYKIKDNETKKCYIGSTKQGLKKRIIKHKTSKKKCKSIEILNKNDYTIDFVEINCINKKQALMYETIAMLCNDVVNSRKAYATKKENKERYKKYYKKEKHKEKNKKWRENNKERHKEMCKKWIENNKERHKELCKKQYEKRKQKFNCECGGKYTLGHKSRHFKTKIHQKYLQQQNK
jgi:hypothetical protein